MRVLIACEFSGTVRDAFRRRGHDAMSCDLLPTEAPGPHHQGDVLPILGDGWDLLIAHPPCTYLTRAGDRWLATDPTRAAKREDAIRFVLALATAPVPRIAIENPRGILLARWRRPDQVIQPWEHGHPECKATCLWLKGLPPLMATALKELPREKRLAQRLHWLPPSPDRWKLRSKTFHGIAEAMAEQWGGLRAPSLIDNGGG